MERNFHDPNFQSDSDSAREAYYRDFVDSYARFSGYGFYRNQVTSFHNTPTNYDYRFPAPDVAGNDHHFGFNPSPYRYQNEPPLQEPGSRNHVIPSYTCPICPANAVDSGLIAIQSNVGQNQHLIPDFSGGGGGRGDISDFYNLQQIPSSYNGFYAATASNFMVHAHGVQSHPPISDFSFLAGGGGSTSGTYPYPSHPTPSSTNSLSHVAAVASYNFKTRLNGLPIQLPISDFGGSTGGGGGGSDIYSHHRIGSCGLPISDFSGSAGSVGGCDINRHHLIRSNGLPIRLPISDFGGGGGGSDINSQYWIQSSNTTSPPAASDYRTRSDIGLQYQQQQPFSNFGFVRGHSHGGASNFYPNHQIPSANNTLHSAQVPPPSSYRPTTLHNRLPHDSINLTSNNTLTMIRAIRPVGFIDQSAIYQVTDEPSSYRHTTLHNTLLHDGINPTNNNNTQTMISAIRPVGFIDHYGIYQRTDEFSINQLNRQPDVISPYGIFQRTDEFSINQLNRQPDEAAILDELHLLNEEILSLQAENEDYVSTGTGLSEETISKHLKTQAYNSSARTDKEPEICVVCQAECVDQEKIATLPCGHGYHADCIKEWLLQKNFCPICKATALNL